MTFFEKVIVSLIDDDIRTIDLTEAAGFVDSYTQDPDNPSGEKELFLMYDCSKMNDYTIDRARRFSTFKNIKKTYVKYIDNKAYTIYSFWIPEKLKKLYSGVMILNVEQKASVLQFWSVFSDTTKSVLSNNVLTATVTHTMPLEDFVDFCTTGLQITKGSSLE